MWSFREGRKATIRLEKWPSACENGLCSCEDLSLDPRILIASREWSPMYSSTVEVEAGGSLKLGGYLAQKHLLQLQRETLLGE